MQEHEKKENAGDPGDPAKSRLRKDLLSPEEARTELHRRLTNVVPDLPALGVVIIMGAVGAALSCWWRLSIGENELAANVLSLSVWLRIFLGSIGATAAVFLLAKTDTSKLIHCGLIAVLSGMAGPYLVTKALSTVVSINPELVKVGGGITIVKSSTETLQREIQSQGSETNPQKIIDSFDQTAQATASYLSVLKGASAPEKKQALAGTKEQLQATLKVLNAAAAVVPRQSLPLLKKVADEASNAGAPEIAQQAQQIIDTNSAVRAAADTAAKSGKVYFIAPEEVTDLVLHDLRDRIEARFSLADIQPAVHPTRRIDPGLEIVYYRDLPGDKQIAEDLAKVVTDYFKDRKMIPTAARVRKGISDQNPKPFQFDIHVGPDVASNLISKPPPPH